MGFIDRIVNRFFSDEKEGRVVILGSGRGYLVRSAREELRVRAFLRMYVFAWLAIQTLGTLLVTGWLSSFLGATGTPTLERELARGGVFLAVYSLVVGLPFFFLWRAYRQGISTFVSPEDAVALDPRPMERGQRTLLVLLALLLVAMGLTIVALVHARP